MVVRCPGSGPCTLPPHKKDSAQEGIGQECKEAKRCVVQLAADREAQCGWSRPTLACVLQAADCQPFPAAPGCGRRRTVGQKTPAEDVEQSAAAKSNLEAVAAKNH